ncbi:Precorrin-2 dehydrogenase [Paenibacillus plantiphilus]|uniref:precorrin-2 dehydrogenase n=1 Tax=Paenibacillus plantiphilus TaxID=2905650 RepID=A0ABN8GFF0_9BACL|nr:bifunctional precorrin-2 dehydrogenase/sirohydrochlorin ferrochelatase [Paenibacillus plantiphilus]CAH1204154.1 Precorrin-2 dehydrogenase [Paenibacillus plantiphilus]
MVAYYPVMLDLNGKRCVVVGGGAVAERKVRGLLAAGANELIVVSPQATSGLEQLSAEGSILLKCREYLESDLFGAAIVFAATPIRSVNDAIATACRAAAIWVNVADLAEQGDFVTPAAVRRGELLIAITTGGASPALTARMKRELEALYGEDFAGRLALLRELRERMLAREPDEARRHAILRLAAEIVAVGNPAEVRADESIEDWIVKLGQTVDGRHT